MSAQALLAVRPQADLRCALCSASAGLADGSVVGEYYQGTDLRDAAHAHNVNAYAGFTHGAAHVKTG